MSTNVQPRGRLEAVDAQRGLAVVLMLWMHSADAWLEHGRKAGAAWDGIRALGGLAAPGFVLLAGLSVGLGWRRSGGGGPRTGRVELARGLQLVVLGYGLRLQMWLVDAGGYARVSGLGTAILVALAYVLAYQALGAWAAGARPFARASGALLAGAAAWLGPWLGLGLPDPPDSLLRVDVLQAIGGSIALLALLRRPLARWPALGLALAVGVTLATPLLRARMPGVLPWPLAAYVAQWPAEPGARVMSLFPLFPWSAYAFVGAAIGPLIGAAAVRGQAGRTLLFLAATGAALAFASCESLPQGNAMLTAFPILEQVVRVAYRVGLVMLLGALALGSLHTPLRAPLIAFGRASLFVYWVHLELAFGVLAKPLQGALDYPAWAAAFAGLSLVMALLTRAWIRVRPLRPRSRPDPAPTPEPELSRA